jgi:photosystem II stability/assembly factor-like uncharacterized protein
MTVKGYEQTDFRDIEAFDERTAVIMGIASPAYILRTVDGGDSWNIVYENKGKSMFLDAMEFWDDRNGDGDRRPPRWKVFSRAHQ